MSQGFNSMTDPDAYLEHYGIKGQKWGERRYQNPDGTWTTAGKERYGHGKSFGSGKSLSTRVGEKRLQNRIEKYENKVDKSAITISDNKRFQSTNVQAAKKLTEDQLADPERTKSIGKRTIVQRTIASVAGVTGSATAYAISAGIATTASLAVPIAAVPAATAAWYLYKTKD